MLFFLSEKRVSEPHFHLKNALLHPTFYLVGMTFQSTARENSIVFDERAHDLT